MSSQSKKVAGLITTQAFCVPLACSFLLLPSWQRQAVIGWLKSVIENMIEYKQVSFSHDQKSKYTSANVMNSRLKCTFYLVADCLFTLMHAQCLFTLCPTIPHICLCIRGNWRRMSSDEHVCLPALVPQWKQPWAPLNAARCPGAVNVAIVLEITAMNRSEVRGKLSLQSLMITLNNLALAN